MARVDEQEVERVRVVASRLVETSVLLTWVYLRESEGERLFPGELAAATSRCFARSGAVIAPDAPCGWPSAMVSAVSSWRPGGRWTAPEDSAPFRLRRTDQFTAKSTAEAVKRNREAKVRGIKPAVPLSVSADKLAMTAWRCCRLLSELAADGAEVLTDALDAPFASDGPVRVVEAYPAAALAMWGVSREGYKDDDARAIARHEEMLTAIEGAGSERWLSWSDRTREQCKETDRALDALVCALVARAAMLGLVETVPNDASAAARAEGWIALPRVGSLRAFAASSAAIT